MKIKILTWLIKKLYGEFTPIVWTTKGNVPEKALTYFHSWEEDDTSVVFVEGYKLEGEVVKRAVHVKIKQGLEFNGFQEAI